MDLYNVLFIIMVVYTALCLNNELILCCNSASVNSMFMGFIGFIMLPTNRAVVFIFTIECHFK